MNDRAGANDAGLDTNLAVDTESAAQQRALLASARAQADEADLQRAIAASASEAHGAARNPAAGVALVALPTAPLGRSGDEDEQMRLALQASMADANGEADAQLQAALAAAAAQQQDDVLMQQALQASLQS